MNIYHRRKRIRPFKNNKFLKSKVSVQFILGKSKLGQAKLK